MDGKSIVFPPNLRCCFREASTNGTNRKYSRTLSYPFELPAADEMHILEPCMQPAKEVCSESGAMPPSASVFPDYYGTSITSRRCSHWQFNRHHDEESPVGGLVCMI